MADPTNLFSMLLGGYGYNEQLKNLGQMGTDVGTTVGDVSNLAGTLKDYGTFKPYTVTGSTGNVNVTEGGGYTMGLTPQQQAFQQQMFGQAGTMLGQAGQGIEDRTNQLFGQMQQSLAPQQERDRLALEERLAAQGRLGVNTAMYGGTPDEFKLNKAQQEAMNQAYFGSRQAALGEQKQAADLGQAFLKSSYAPEAQLLSLLSPSVNLSNIATTSGTNLGGMLSELGLGGLTARTNIESERNRLLGDLLKTVGSSSTGLANVSTGNEYADTLLKYVFGAIGGDK